MTQLKYKRLTRLVIRTLSEVLQFILCRSSLLPREELRLIRV
jgi:hypothetical protein